MSLMPLYRVVHRKYAEEAFSGRGGLHADGRWHSQGRLVCYASDSLALATLEQIARVGTLERLKEMVYVKADMDSEAGHSPPQNTLPPDWNSHPPGTASQRFGDDWLSSRSAVCLRIPSVILPEGCNFILNPAHPDFSDALQVNDALPLQLDPRILDRTHVTLAN